MKHVYNFSIYFHLGHAFYARGEYAPNNTFPNSTKSYLLFLKKYVEKYNVGKIIYVFAIEWEAGIYSQDLAYVGQHNLRIKALNIGHQ